MGCNSSKDADVQDQNKPKDQNKDKGGPSQKDQKDKQEKKKEPFEDYDESVEYVQKELNVSKEVAKKIVDRANKDGDDKVEGSELKALWKDVKELRDELKPKFEEEDKNGNGVISVTAAGRIVQDRYGDMNDKSLKNIFKQFGDTDGDNKIEYGELIVFCHYMDESNKELRPLFEKADEGKTGVVTLTEAAKVLSERYPRMSKEGIKSILRSADNGDGKVNYAEFILFNAKIKQAKNEVIKQFDKWDTNDDGSLAVDYAARRLAKAAHMDEDDAKNMIHAANTDNDGNITKDEFIGMWSSFC